MMDITDAWVEALFLIMLILGWVLALFISSPAVSYTVIFLCGAAFGKTIHHKKEDFFLPYILLTVGFIIGYLIGHRTGSIWAISAIFALGNMLSFFAHEKGLF